jgi:flagellar biosynthesis protein FlhG
MDQAEDLRKMFNKGAAIRKQPALVEVPAVARSTRFIAVASGKGGVGKTNFAINLGILFARAGKRVLVMDMDLGLANVNVLLGVIPKFNLYHVLKGEKALHEVIIDTSQGIRIIAGASGFSKLADLSEDERMRFVEGLSQIGDVDIVIIDTGAGVSRNVLSFVLAADETIIITTPEPTAITDAYGIVKTIKVEGVPENFAKDGQLPIKLVVNRVSSAAEGRQVAERVINIAGQFLNVHVENLGFIYHDEMVGASVMKQKPFVAVAPNSRASECMDLIARRLLDMPIDVKPEGFGGFIKKLFAANKGG